MIELLVVLIVVGVLVYVLNAIVPMDARFKLVLNACIGLVLFLWILSVFGLINLPARLR